MGVGCLALLSQGCALLKTDADGSAASDWTVPEHFPVAEESANSALLDWKEYFRDETLAGLISDSLARNQELNILLQEIAVSKSEVLQRKGAVFPFVRLGAGGGVDKVGEFTRSGAVEENLEIRPGEAFPDPLSDFNFRADFSWEVDIWRRLRNERDAAVLRYLASQEGRTFMVTNLVSEIARSYYELLALDNQADILRQTIEVQQSALEAVRLQKAAAKVTELAVRRFEAEVLKNQSRVYDIRQQITVLENRLNFLAGRYPTPIQRKSVGFERLSLASIAAGVPSDLLRNRPDVRRAELELKAAGLEVKAASARFYPSLDIGGALGFNAFQMGSLLTAPESVAYNAVADLAAPLINRSAIKAAFQSANARQLAALYQYQQTMLNAYVEVVNQLAQIRNLGSGYDLKTKEVETLTGAIGTSVELFNAARADYTEVLLTQRDTLDARLELIELKQRQLSAWILAYRALGGGYDRSKPAAAAAAVTRASHSKPGN